MMPRVDSAPVQSGRHHRVRLWVPLVLVLLLLSPLLLVAALILAVVCLAYGIHPGRTVIACWRLLTALRGLRVEVHQGRTDVLIRVI